MQSLSTDVLILFNAMEPVKMVQKIILNSTAVQTAFKVSCFMLTAEFTNETNLVDGKDPICYLHRSLIQGFIRVYSNDIYQLRLSNVLLSKTGASGIRTNLLTLSGNSEKSKKYHLKTPLLTVLLLCLHHPYKLHLYLYTSALVRKNTNWKVGTKGILCRVQLTI